VHCDSVRGENVEPGIKLTVVQLGVSQHEHRATTARAAVAERRALEPAAPQRLHNAA
jgi:hypothetical protein